VDTRKTLQGADGSQQRLSCWFYPDAQGDPRKAALPLPQDPFLCQWTSAPSWLDTPVSGFSSTLDTGSPAYSPCSRTTSSVRLGFGFSQPGCKGRCGGQLGWPSIYSSLDWACSCRVPAGGRPTAPIPNHLTLCALDAHGVGPAFCTVSANGIADGHLALLDMAPNLPGRKHHKQLIGPKSA
jgi:hypothetical protein